MNLRMPQVPHKICVAALDSSPIRFHGYGALLGGDPAFELISLSLPEIRSQERIDVAVAHLASAESIAGLMREIAVTRPSLRVLLTSCDVNDEFTVSALMHGARGCLDETRSAQSLARAIRAIDEGLIWAPRRTLSEFVVQASSSLRQPNLASSEPITVRERQVLEMLVTGRSNKEIAAPLGIEERTVKAHVSALMRKVGVHNRIMLSKHALSSTLLFSGQ
jgi:DNA-binding NarL/FixJ family response regulator